MKVWMLSLSLVASVDIMAQESGYFHNGKKHVLFQDGVKKRDAIRSPASLVPANKTSPETIIRYEVDNANGIICYWRDGADANTPLSCLKK